MMWRTAMITQSVGVPFTAYCCGPDFAQAQRIVERQRMRDAGLSVSGATTQTSSDKARAISSQTFKPRRMNAVVVGDKDAHYLVFSILFMPPI